MAQRTKDILWMFSLGWQGWVPHCASNDYRFCLQKTLQKKHFFPMNMSYILLVSFFLSICRRAFCACEACVARLGCRSAAGVHFAPPKFLRQVQVVVLLSQLCHKVGAHPSLHTSRHSSEQNRLLLGVPMSHGICPASAHGSNADVCWVGFWYLKEAHEQGVAQMRPSVHITRGLGL